MEQNQTNAVNPQTNKPQLDVSNVKEKLEQGIWNWRYDKESDVAVLDVKEFTLGGIETGVVHSYPFEELTLERERHNHQARMMSLDAQILQYQTELLTLKEKKIFEEKRFEKEFGVILDGVTKTLEQAKKKK